MKKQKKNKKPRKRTKSKKVRFPTKKTVTQSKHRKPMPAKENNNVQVPLITLPLYDYLNKSDYWYGLLPELICIQGIWIKENIAKLKIPKEISPYIKNAVYQHHTALMVAGNNHAYFSLHSLRSIMERIAMGWMIHSSSPLKITEIIGMLSSDNMTKRKLATQKIMELAQDKDEVHAKIYDMTSQYFAHASKMDGVSLNTGNLKSDMLGMRIKVMPLLLLLDVGTRLVTLIKSLLEDQSIPAKLPKGGKLEGEFDIDTYVRGCAYLMCEKHSPNKGIRLATLFQNIKEIKGAVGITTYYRGGMEVTRHGDPKDKPDPKEIADFCWYAIGRNHNAKVNVKCVSEGQNGEVYKLNWPKHLEYDSTGLGIVAMYEQSNIQFFDYISALLKVIEDT